MKFVKPNNTHIKGLISLSKSFLKEFDWANSVPIGQIDTEEKARKKLFDKDVIAALLAEDNNNLVGFIGVYKYTYNNEEGYEASILIDSNYRGIGLGKKLCDKVFEDVPNNIEVEAWVLDINKPSMKATPKMGFKLKKSLIIDDHEPLNGLKVNVFTRKGERQE